MQLDHADADCTGAWRLTGSILRGRTLVCDGCGASYADTPENRRYARDEANLAFAARLAADTGAAILAAERRSE